MNYIAIDGGTTNTRISLLRDGEVLDTLALPIGAGDNAKAPGSLQRAVKQGIATLLSRHALKEADVREILGSGMLTSELGLFTVAHLIAPVSLEDMKRGVQRTSLPDVSSIPFCFAAGVKTESEQLSELDMMRGEETELVGLFGEIPRDAVVLLPGSHSKIIRTDGEGRIVGIKTMLTGEMLSVLSRETVLRGSFSFSDALLLPEQLEEGFLYAEQNGLGDALFKVRVLKMRCDYTPDMLYSFYLGAILHDEVKAVLGLIAREIYIGGREQIKKALYHLLASRTPAEVTVLDAYRVAESTVRGLFIVCTQ